MHKLQKPACVLHLATSIQYSGFSVGVPVVRIKSPASIIQYPVSRIQCLVCSAQYPGPTDELHNFVRTLVPYGDILTFYKDLAWHLA